MGKCIYCGQNAGIFRNKHTDCERRHNEGIEQIKTIITACFKNREDFYLHKNEIERIKMESFVRPTECDNVFVGILDRAIDQYLDDGIIDAEEERIVARFAQFTELPQSKLNENMSLEKVVQSRILQDLMEGNEPVPRITISGEFPFILNRGENLLWLFRNITLQMQKVRKEYVGRSRGMSFRICRGVYYRTGGFKGHPVETTYMDRVATGDVCLTTKNLYFHGLEKSLKIPLKKIIAIEPFSNGLQISTDGTRSKPMFFENLNSWFCYNVIMNLQQQS